MIFVDTSFWVALRNRRDPNHEMAKVLLEDSIGRGLVTSNHVRGETWTFLRRRGGHRAAVQFIDQLARSRFAQVEFVTSGMEARALKWLRARDEREYSFVDATSFVLMRARRMREVLAFDGDFSAAGFVELRT